MIKCKRRIKKLLKNIKLGWLCCRTNTDKYERKKYMRPRYAYYIYIYIYIYIYAYHTHTHIYIYIYICIFYPVSLGCRIHRLLLFRGVRPLAPNDCPRYDGEVPVMLKLSGVWSTPSLSSLPGSLWPGVVTPDEAPISGLNRTKPQFQEFIVFAFKLRIYTKLNCLK